jgi:hypothetical protein
MRTGTKRIAFAILLTLSLATAFFVIRSVLLSKMTGLLEEKIQQLNKSDFNIQYDSIHFNWKKNIVVIEELVIEKDAYDTTCLYPEFISADEVRLEGFSLLTFLLKRKAAFETITFTEPHIVVRQQSKLLPDSVQQRENEFTVAVEKLNLISAHIEYTGRTACQVITDIKSTVTVTDITLDFYAHKPLGLTIRKILCDSSSINLPRELYLLRFARLEVDLQRSSLQLDTLTIHPHLHKIAFAKKKEYESDRIEGAIPSLRLSDLKFQYRDTFFLNAEALHLQMFLKVFRDKRLPDKPKFTLLPIQQLRKLSFGLSIDSLKIHKSYVEYEEFPEGLDREIKVYFDNLEATILDINNDPEMGTGETMLAAQANFMGKGILEMTTVFPWQTNKKCQLKGTLRNFPLALINPVLEPIANMEIESGIMDQLVFHYNYDMHHSAGEVQLNYHDLKLISYKDDEKIEEQQKRKKNKDYEDLRKDNLKSFLINFVIRKNMNEKVPEDKRTGQIDFERNTSRSIFNYWWKSLYSGIKSAYNLDRLPVKSQKAADPDKKERKKNKKKK